MALGEPGQGTARCSAEADLVSQILGVDVDEHAVRVASFSLYLAMCDEIEPRHYWNRMRFPRLRGTRLVHADFFEEREGIRTNRDARRYDLVVGNAPWGQDSWTEPAEAWAKLHKWPLVNKGIGTLFLAKAAMLAKRDGSVAMMTSANALLFNRGSTALAFRTKLFSDYSFEELVNLSAVRFGIFAGAKGASCIVFFRPVPPSSDAFPYICPKPTTATAPVDGLVVEPDDVQVIFPEEAASDPWVWTALLWGGRRDLELVRRLARQVMKKPVPRISDRTTGRDMLTTLDQLDKDVLQSRKGIVRGDRETAMPAIVGRRILEDPEFPPGTFLRLRAQDLHINRDPGVDTSDGTSSAPFDLPQLIIKKAWSVDTRRFGAVLVDADPAVGGVICTQAYMTVHVPEASRHVLDAACLMLNSTVAGYYLFLTSGRSASFIPEALVEELLGLPLPTPRPELIDGLAMYADVDARVHAALGLKEPERVLVEDFMNHTVRRIQHAGSSGWRTSPEPAVDADDDDLTAYCERFLLVLRHGVGARAAATAFRSQTPNALPVHLVAVYLDHPAPPPVNVERIQDDVLIDRLGDLNRLYLHERPPGAGGVFFRRTARIYDTAMIEGVKVPVVYVVKPRALRYWTRATALRDADEVVVDAALWVGAGGRDGEEHEHGD